MPSSSKLIIAILTLTLSVLSCKRHADYVEMSGCVWNTTYHIKYCGPTELADSVNIIMRQVEMSLSPFNPQSLISAINRCETDSVNQDITAVFNMSRRINAISGKAFDPTLSPLINLWGFGYERKGDSINVSPSDVVLALMKVGIDSCSIVDGHLLKKHPETTFNFSAITKGYGCDRIGEMFRHNSCESFMVEIGGELCLSGLNERGKPWRVMIEYPNESPDRDYTGVATVELTDCAVATSGNYRNYRDTDNGRIGHTIDLKGYPVKTSTLSATIIAPECAQADALATACMAMSPDSALAMVEMLNDVECMLVVAGDGYPDIKKSSHFPL